MSNLNLRGPGQLGPASNKLRHREIHPNDLLVRDSLFLQDSHPFPSNTAKTGYVNTKIFNLKLSSWAENHVMLDWDMM